MKAGDRVVCIEYQRRNPGFLGKDLVVDDEYTLHEIKTSPYMGEIHASVVSDKGKYHPICFFRKIDPTSTKHEFTNEVTKELVKTKPVEEKSEPVREPKFI